MSVLSLLACSGDILLHWTSTTTAAGYSHGVLLLDAATTPLVVVLELFVHSLIMLSLVNSCNSIRILVCTICVDLRGHILKLVVRVNVGLDPLDFFDRVRSISTLFLGIVQQGAIRVHHLVLHAPDVLVVSSSLAVPIRLTDVDTSIPLWTYHVDVLGHAHVDSLAIAS